MSAKINFYTEIGKNKRDSIFLVIIVLVIVAILLWVIAQAFAPGWMYLILPILAALVIVDAVFSYYKGDSVVLRSTKAKLAEPGKNLYLMNAVEGLALASGIPVPKVYILPDKDINAYATGRDPAHASIAVTKGALEKLNRQELEGVLAHEMSHIGNYDIRYMLLVAVFVGLVAIIGQTFLRGMIFGGGRRDDNGIILLVAILFAVIAPIVVRLVQLSISRKREFLADATAAKITRYPPGLASALEKIAKLNKGNKKVSDAVSHLYIADPKHSALNSLFATHPPIEQRIEKLRAM